MSGRNHTLASRKFVDTGQVGRGHNPIGTVTAQGRDLTPTFQSLEVTGPIIAKGGIAALNPFYIGGYPITVNGPVTLNDWFNQSVKTTASPTFAGATIAGTFFTDWFNQNVRTEASPSFAGLRVNGSLLTVNGPVTLNDWFNQSVKTTASPQFTAVTAGSVNATTIEAVGFKSNGLTGLTVDRNTFVFNKAGGGFIYLGVTGGIVTHYNSSP